MSRQEAIKARIKKLENDMLGLMYRLNQMQPSSPKNEGNAINVAFNATSKRQALYSLFENASQVQAVLTRQILSIRDELASLQAPSTYDYDFRLTA